MSIETTREWRKRNKERAHELTRNWKRANPEKMRAAKLKHRYGITPEEYDALVLSQNNQCKICLKPAEKRLVVDHHHGTKQIRGLLCGKCNSALGLLQDSAEILRRAANYLEGSQNDLS